VTVIEILVIVSTTLQVGISIFALFILRHLTPKEGRVWFWFMIPLLLLVLRRILAISRYMEDWPTLEVEYFISITISLCLANFMYRFVNSKINGKKPEVVPPCSKT